MREQDWRANYYEALRERNEAEERLTRVEAHYERGRQDERRAWQKALIDSALPSLYVRLVRDLATLPCDNCGGDIATCDCDES